MSQLMLVNPAKRRKSHRSAAQKAATRRMLAANRSKRHHNPSPRRVKHHRSAVARVTHHIRRRRHHNPISAGGIGGMLLNSIKGAGGAITVNLVTNYLPDSVRTGNVLYLTRAAVAIALGTLGRKVLGNNARVMAEGALTVNTHDFINSMAGSMLPGSGLRGVGKYMSGVSPQAHLTNPDVGFTGGDLSGMGEYLYATGR
jgi:hypothetical protein